MKDEKRMKRVLAILLTIIVCLGIFTACKNDNIPPSLQEPTPTLIPDDLPYEPETPTDIPEGKSQRQMIAEQYGLPYDPAMDDWEPVTFTYFCLASNQPPDENNPIIDILERITNVKIDFQFYNIDFNLALGVMIEANDMPDLAYFGKNSSTAIDSGHFIPIDNLIESYAPKLREFYDPWWEYMRHNDRHVYTAEIHGTLTGTQTAVFDDTYAFWIQKDVLDHFGRAPDNIDEYFDFIREYKELNPTVEDSPTIGFSFFTGDYLNSGLVNGGYFLAGNANWGGAINMDGNYFGAALSPAERWTNEFNRTWWEKLHEEYHLNTFSRNVFTASYREYVAQISSGAVLGIFDTGKNIRSAVDSLIKEELYERTYLPLALTYPGISPNYLDAQEFTGGNGIIISNTISDPQRAIEYLEYIIDEKVQRFLSWGIEGEHYYYDENNRISRTQQQRELQKDESWVNNNLGRLLLEMMPKMQGTYPSDNNPTSPGQSPEENFAALTGYDKDLFEKLGISTMAGFWGEPKQRPVFYPFADPEPEEDPEETTEASLVIERITNILRRNMRNMITAREGRFERFWDEYIVLIDNIDQMPLMEFYEN